MDTYLVLCSKLVFSVGERAFVADVAVARLDEVLAELRFVKIVELSH
jgi:hypothetical protein